jgi:MoaA/NifB/PqqE/SkfB family radical SAM enzyme
MSFWEDISQLHLEFSALCNAVCPCCRRYPVAGHEVLPSINNTQVWTLTQVKERLPANDIKHIKQYLINGNYGDFVTNHEAIDILEYLHQSSPNSFISISTNGSARNEAWWDNLARRCGKVEVYFCIDGLEDTHNLYRRQTDWKTIIKNAQAFAKAGGDAVWTMTTFEHNEHQVEQCRQLSKDLGFTKFEVRYNTRETAMARDKNGESTHWVRDTSASPTNQLYKLRNKDQYGEHTSNLTDAELNTLQKTRWIQIEAGTFKSKQAPANTSPMSKKQCPSLNHQTGGHSIFVSARWLVSPCCHIAGAQEMGNLSTFIDDINRRSNTTIESLTANSTQTVKDIVDRGFAWVYDSFEKPASVCLFTCGKQGAFATSMQTKKVITLK